MKDTNYFSTSEDGELGINVFGIKILKERGRLAPFSVVFFLKR
jgi:hypothetical protein